MYYFISSSEDGLRIRMVEDGEAEVAELARENEDLRDDCQYYFTDKLPDDYTDTNAVYIIKGENVLPTPVTKVTEYRL